MSTHNRPWISIVIPTYNRPNQLRNCLEAIAKTEYAVDRFELIIVDDGGQYDPEDIIRELRDRLSIQLISKENGGPASARNAGAAAAAGRFIAFTDDDCSPPPEWLPRLEACLQREPNSMIGGRSVNAFPLNSFSAASQLILDVVYQFYNADGRDPRFFASNNIAMGREQFNELGGFDTGFPLAAGEDRDFCDRWIHHGLKLVYEPQIVVSHAHSLNLTSFCKQHFNYGRGAYLYHRFRARRQSGRMWDDARMHVRLPQLLRDPMFSLPIRQRCKMVALLSLWQITNAAGFFWQGISGRGGR